MFLRRKVLGSVFAGHSLSLATLLSSRRSCKDITTSIRVNNIQPVYIEIKNTYKNTLKTPSSILAAEKSFDAVSRYTMLKGPSENFTNWFKTIKLL